MIVAAYSDGGFWTLLWRICSSLWISGRGGSFPPRGFVGLGSTSRVVSDLYGCKLKSIRLRRRADTRHARLWRLTFKWATNRPPLHRLSSGRSSAPGGGRWAAGGVVTSRRPTTSILTSRASESLSARLSEGHIGNWVQKAEWTPAMGAGGRLPPQQTMPEMRSGRAFRFPMNRAQLRTSQTLHTGF